MYTCSMPAARFIHLIDDDAKQLRAIEQNAHLKPKVRLRAQVLRRSHRGDTVAQIAASTGRRATSICRDLDRWQDHGVAGLADGMAPGQPPRITAEVAGFLQEQLAEARTSTAIQPAEAVEPQFGIAVSAEAVRQHLHRLGYAWKRTRYVPAKSPDPEQKRVARETLAGRTRGLATATLRYLDATGPCASAPGAQPVGLAGPDQCDRHALSGGGHRAG